MSEILYPDGTKKEVHPKNPGKPFTLKELQAIVEGHIELVRTRDGKQLIINAEGKFEDLPRNEQATALVAFPSAEEIQRLRDEHPEVIFIGSMQEPDYIAGIALLCDDAEVR